MPYTRSGFKGAYNLEGCPKILPVGDTPCSILNPDEPFLVTLGLYRATSRRCVGSWNTWKLLHLCGHSRSFPKDMVERVPNE
jgi:hypothetical protein